MKIKKNIIYVESPLQFFSSISFLRKNYKESLLLYYKKDNQLESLIENSNFSINYIKFTLPNIIKLIFQSIIIYRIKVVGVGDLRSTRSLFSILFFGKSKLLLFDDGNYSSNLDQNGDYKINLGYANIKSSYIKYILNRYRIHRYTIFNHTIKRPYAKIVKSNSSKTLKFINIDNNKDGLSHFNSNSKTFFYIESNLDGWTENSTEQKVYNIINEYCNDNEYDLVILAHRLTPIKRIKEFTREFTNIKCVKLNVPVELFLILNDHNNFIFGFSITSALHTGTELINNSKIINIKIPQKYIFNQFKEVADNHYARFYSYGYRMNKEFEELEI